MSEWQDITTAPKDGSFVLLCGGETAEDDYLDVLVDLKHRLVVGMWESDGWVFSYWDGKWRSEYLEPKYWMPLPSAPE